MNKDKVPVKLTKSELIKTGIIAFILLSVFAYSLYKSGAIRQDLIGFIICIAIGLIALPLPIYIGIKIGLKNRQQIKASLQQNKRYKPIWIFGILAMLFGAFLNTNGISQIAWMLAGLGLILKKRWGLYTFIIIAAIYSLLVIADLLSGTTLQLLRHILPNRVIGPNFAIGAIILIRGLTLVFCISGICYLTRPKAKEQFKHK